MDQKNHSDIVKALLARDKSRLEVFHKPLRWKSRCPPLGSTDLFQHAQVQPRRPQVAVPPEGVANVEAKEVITLELYKLEASYIVL